MSKRCLAVLVAGLAACSDGGQPLDGPQPQVEPQVEPPLIGTLTTYSMTDTHLAPLPVTPTFVAYRGEGGDWERVEAVGPTTAFTIEHPRYMLWVACPFTDAGRDSVHALLLTDQDSLEPAVRCPLPPSGDDARAFTFEAGDLGTFALSASIGAASTGRFHQAGGVASYIFVGPAPGPYDLVTLLEDRDGPAIRIRRDFDLSEDLLFRFAMQEHLPLEPELQPEPIRFPRQRYITGNRTEVTLPEGGFALYRVPEALRDPDDIYQLVSEVGAGNQLTTVSYRQDPGEATLTTPEPLSGGALVDLGPRRFSIVLPTSDSPGIQVMQVHLQPYMAWADVEVWISEGHLTGPDVVTVELPPEFEPTWRMGEAGDQVGAVLTARWSNRDGQALSELLNHGQRIVPRSLDGLDVGAAEIRLPIGTIE